MSTSILGHLIFQYSRTDLVAQPSCYVTRLRQNKTHPQFDHDAERITTRKELFTLYNNEQQITQFKIWIGEILGGNSIAFSHGQSVDVGNDGWMNESLSLEENEGQLKFKPL